MLDEAELNLIEYRGRSKRDAIRLVIHSKFGIDAPGNEERVNRMYKAFREAVECQFRDHGVIPISGAEETFSWLRQRRVKIAVTTGFDRQLTDLFLDQLSWDKDMFDATVCSDEVPQGRPAPHMIFRAMELTGTDDVNRVMKVGDTPADIHAGANAGVRTIGVLTGPHDKPSLQRADPDHIIPSIAAIPALFIEEDYVS